MKKLLLASASLLALGIVSANAADIQQRMPVKAAPVYLPPAYNWTGAYVGINGGAGFGSGSTGGLIGGTLGYNWQVGTLVYGIEGDLDYTRIRSSSSCAFAGCESRNHWLGTVRGRIGYAADRFMPYLTGGLAVGDVENNIPGVGSESQTKAGYALGAGLEAALWQNWTAKIEYLYVDLGRGPTVAGLAGSDNRFRSNLVRVGLNYRF